MKSTLFKIWKVIIWPFWELMGIRHIWSKIFPPVNRKTGKRPPPATILLWTTGIYVALFGIASQRYENRIDIIENRANAMFAQLSTPAAKKALSRIPRIQKMKCPLKPALINPKSIVSSLFREGRYHEMVKLLQETVEDWKYSLSDVSLVGADLKGVNLYGANLRGTDLRKANLTGAKLQVARFHKANLYRADLSGADLMDAKLQGVPLTEANLEGANFQGAYLVAASFRGANLLGVNFQAADLRSANFQGNIQKSVLQLSRVLTLYQAKMDVDLRAQIEKKYPHLLEEQKDEDAQ